MAFVLLAFLCAFSAACTSHKREAYAQTVSINDLAPFWDDDVVNGSRWAFEITAVNGQPPKRAQHRIATVIPYVVIPAGVHEIEVKVSRSPSADPKQNHIEVMTVRTTVEAGKHYRLAIRDRHLALVESPNALKN